MKKLLTFFYIVTVLTVFLLNSLSANAAGTASLTMSPGSGNYIINTSFNVTVYENSASDMVNVVQADLNFNQTLLQLTKISCNNAAFEISAPGGGNGITCGTTTPKSGNQSVATATFKVIGSGTATLNFATTSHIYRSTDNIDIWNGSLNSATYNLSAAVVNPTPTPTSTNIPTPTPTTSSNNSRSSRRSNPTPTPTTANSPTPTNTPQPTSSIEPTPTPTKNIKSNKRPNSNKRWHLWGLTFVDSNSGPYIGGGGLAIVILASIAYVLIRRRDLLKHGINKIIATCAVLKHKIVPANAGQKLDIQKDAFFARLQTTTQKIDRIARHKKA